MEVVAGDDDALVDLESTFAKALADEAGGGHVVMFNQ